MAVDLGTAVGKIIIDSDGAVRGIAQAETVMGKLAGAAKVAGVAIGAGMVAAGGALIKLGIEAGKSAASMEQSMANIAATMSKSRDEIAPLGDLIKGLAVNPNLKVSATEAADAVAMLARNGLDMAQIMEGAAEATVYLANATGGTFSQSADIMTDAMAIFGIEAANAMEAVNGITSVTTNSKFSIDDYALALAQGGGAASAAGVEFDDFNTAIAAISPLFASGSDAGTSFKVMMQRLAAPTDEAAALMQQLGIQAYDSSGNLRSMSDISATLHGSLAGLTEQQRAQALTTIFGSDAMRAAAGLMESGAIAYGTAAEAAAALGVSIDQVTQFAEGGITQYEALMIAMEQTDAMDAAATRMDTLAGTIDIIKGLVEGFVLQIGEALLPAIRQLADLLLVVAETYGPAIVAFFTSLVGVITGFFANLQEGMTILDAFIESIWGIAPQPVLDALVNLRDNILPALTELFNSFITPLIELAAGFVQWQDVLIVLAGLLLATVIPAIGALVVSIATLAAPILAAIAVVALLRTAWEENWGGIQEKTQAVIDFIVPLVNGAIEGIKAWWAENGDAILAKAAEIWGSVKGTVETAVTTVTGIANDGIAQIRAFWDEHGAAVLARVQEIWAAIVDAFTTKMEQIKTDSQGFFANIQAFWEAHKDLILGIVESLWDLVVQIFETAKEIIVGIIEVLLSLFIGDWETAKDAMGDVVQSLWDLVAQIFETAATTLANIAIAIVAAIISPFETTDWGSIGSNIISGIANSISEGAGRVADAARRVASAAFQAAKDFLRSDSPSKLFYDLFAWVPAGAAGGITGNVGVLVKAMVDMGQTATDAATDSFKKLGEALSGLNPIFELIDNLKTLDTSQSIESQFLWLNYQLLVMAQAIRAGMVEFGGMIDETKKYAELIKTIIGAIKDSGDVVAMLRDMQMVSVESQVLWLNYQLLVMAQAIRAGMVAFGGMIEESKKYAELIGDVSDAFKDGAEAVAEIGAITIDGSVGAKIDFIANTVQVLVMKIKQMATLTNEGTIVPLVEYMRTQIQGLLDLLSMLGELATAEVPGGIGDIINAIQLQMNLLPDIFQNAAMLAVNNLVTILANAVPQVQQIAAAMGAVITNEMVRGVITGQALVSEAFNQVVAGGRSPLPPVTNNSTTNNYFGGQTYGGGAAGGDAFAQLGLVR